jgi:NitT/TauT family transport system substrate-binding protein
MKKLIYALFLILFLAGCTNQAPQVQKDSNIYVLTMAPGVMRDQFSQNNIQAYIAWEPFNAQTVVPGDGSYLIQSTDIWPNHPCCVLATITEDEQAIKAMIWANIKAVEFMNDQKNQDKVIEYGMNFTGQDRQVIIEALKHIQYVEFPEKEEFRNYYTKLVGFGQLLNKTAEELGYEDDDEFFNDFLDDRYYQEVKQKITDYPNWQPAKIQKPITVSYLTGDLHELAYYVALKEGYYDQVFTDLKAIQFKNGPATMDGFKAGQMDFAYLGGAPATLKRVNSDIKIKIIAGANNAGSAIVSKNNITKVEELAGHTVATPGFGTVQDFILRMAAEQSNLTVQAK